jgi:large subunit ribosomal protein L14
MVQPYTKLTVADNSGAKTIQVITVLGGAALNGGKIGDIVSASVKHAAPDGTVKRKEVVKAVIARTRGTHHRADGSSVRFNDNAAIIINADKNPRGTRVFGPVPRELREKGFTKIISLAPEVV